MAWPLSQDYNEAIQNPQTSFGDAELRGGEAVTNALGVPMPRSGNFADVYEFQGASGQKWAVKCFTRQIPGLQERYSEISKHLIQAKLPFTVDFTYLEKGIRIRGAYYPVLKMQWVEGFLLNEFVRDNLDKPARLDALGQIWQRMAKRLHEANFTHADLQHGNVILVQGSKASSLAVKLIDYDGMWVPALKQKKSGELGHPAYQHPHRLAQAIYSAEVDRLPILAIACALRSLAVGGKMLWNKYDNGDNMLFRESDLRSPKASALLKELWNLSDPAAHDLTGYLAIALSGGLNKVPLLQDLYNGQQPRALTAAQEAQVAALLGPGATVNRSAPQSKLTGVSARPKTGLATDEFAPDWDFSSDPAPSSIVQRKAQPGINPKVMWGAVGVAGVLVLVGGILWLLPKGQTPVAEIAKNDLTPPDVPQKIPEATPTVVEKNKPTITPIVPPEPMPVAEIVTREIPPQPAPPEKNNIAIAADADLSGFVPIFNGKDLTGFEGDLSRWSVQNGIIIGTTVDNPPKYNNIFLIWNGTVDDFELKCKFRLETAKSNSGIQYRSKKINVKDEVLVNGYQADMAAGLNYTGALYETRGRQFLAQTGQKIIIDTNGVKRQVGSLGDMVSILGNDFDVRDWHEYHIIARGNHLQHFIDGKQTIDVIDHQESKRAFEGIIALELNGITIAHFKDITLKRLSRSGVIASERTPLSPTADWRKGILTSGPNAAQEYPDYVRINPNSWISTREPYSGPIEITAIARTANQNIRLYSFNGACVIFNWEANPKELRVNRPDGNDKFESGSLARKAVEPLLPDTWYKLQWRITDEGMTIKVDDKVIFAEQKTYNLAANRPVFVRTMKDSVDVKHLAVERLRSDLEVASLKNKKIDTASTHEVRQFIGHDDDVRFVAFSAPDGRIVYSAGDKTVRFWDRETGQEIRRIETDFKIFSMSLAPDAKKVAVGSAAGGEGIIGVWDLSKKDYTEYARVQASDKGPMPVLLLTGSKKLVSGGKNGGAMFWDVRPGKLLGPQLIEKSPFKTMSLAKTADDKLLAFGGYGGRVKIVNLTGPTPTMIGNIATVSSNLIEALAFSPDAKTLAIAYSQGGKWTAPGQVQFLSVATGKLSSGFVAHQDGMVRALTFSKDGKTLVTASYDQTIKLWQMKNDQGTLQTTLTGHTGPIWCLALSPDGRFLLSGSSDKTVRLWRLPDAETKVKKLANAQ